MESLQPRTSGSALIIILPLVAILTLLVLMVISTSLFDAHHAANIFGKNQAASLARYALDDTSEKLSSIPLDRHWASGPGLLEIWNGTTWNKIDLHSGARATAVTANDYVDGATAAGAAKYAKLNVQLPDGSYTIMPANAEYATAPDMSVKWIYVLADGTKVTDPTMLPRTGVVGRYAYWTDIENGRVNINTAGFGMVNGPPAGDPNNPTGRFMGNFETLLNSSGGNGRFNIPNTTAHPNSYPTSIWTPNPWMSDKPTINATSVTFPALDRLTAQKNTPQNLVAHPSSIDLKYLEGITEQQSFNTFRYAGSYFLRVDARNTYSIMGTDKIVATPDLSVRFFNDPKDWKLIVGDTAYNKNKGYITVRGRMPEINPWGIPKIPLSNLREGHSLNDLTEYYIRTLPETSGDIFDEFYFNDSRRTQVPWTWHPMQPSRVSTLAPGTGTFRDMGDTRDSQYIHTDNTFYISTLMWDLSKLWSTPLPGYAQSFGDKYNHPGQLDQLGVEMMGYLDSVLNVHAPGFTPYVPQQHSNYYGRSAPMDVAGTIRRSPTAGSTLINEISVEAKPISWQSLYTTYSPTPYYGNYLTGSNAIYGSVYPSPKAYETSDTGSPCFFYLLRPINVISPKNPDGTPVLDGYGQAVHYSNDRFVEVRFHVETATPPHWGFVQPYQFYGRTFRGSICNNVVSCTSDDSAAPHTPITLKWDIYGDHTPDSANPGWAVNPFVLSGWDWPNTGVPAVLLNAAPPPPMTPGGTTYGEVPLSSGRMIIGPFAPGTTVSDLEVKARMVFSYDPVPGGWTWTTLPGIFPEFSPDGSTPLSSTGSPVDPRQSTLTTYDGNPTAQQSTYLDFHFKQPIDVDLPDTQTVSYEATDPRVNRYNVDWTVGTADTLGRPNSTQTSIADDSDLARPPEALQIIRGWLRLESGYPFEPQTASRILGMPGVGYLSSVPNAVDYGGVSKGVPFSTLKFYNANETVPDWLMWNLFYVPFDRSMSNQTDGKLNINAKLYPFNITREKP